MHPSRPKGTHLKLSDWFISARHADFEEHGHAVERCHIHGLVGAALVHRAVAEVADADLIATVRGVGYRFEDEAL